MKGVKTHLARRLLVYISGGLLGALLITSIAQYLALKPILEQTRDRSIRDTTDSIAPLIARSLWVFDEREARSAIDALQRNQFVTGVQVNDHSNLFDYRVGDLESSTSLLTPISEAYYERQEQTNILTMPLVITSDDSTEYTYNIGTLRLISRNNTIDQQINALTAPTLRAILISLISLQIVIYILIRKTIAKPLESFTQLIQQLSERKDELPQSSILLNRPDEFGRLAKVFQQQRRDLIERDEALRLQHYNLERIVEERTDELQQTNETLRKSLSQLKQAQQELIQSEKMASLGTLVSGIAHEVNTPLGIAITAASHLIEELHQTQKAMAENRLTKQGFEEFLAISEETEQLLLNNLHRAAALIQSFKKVAVDQSSEEERLINLKSYMGEIIMSLRPRLKQTNVCIHNNIPPAIEITISPGALAQIITNLITNSIIHGFNNGKSKGEIHLNAHVAGSTLSLTYSDNGAGMDETTLKNVYDPFFTTKRSEGGSGLGMNIVYNLVTSKLNGNIETTSSPNNGFNVVITFNITEEVKAGSLDER